MLSLKNVYTKELFLPIYQYIILDKIEESATLFYLFTYGIVCVCIECMRLTR